MVSCLSAPQREGAISYVSRHHHLPSARASMTRTLELFFAVPGEFVFSNTPDALGCFRRWAIQSIISRQFHDHVSRQSTCGRASSSMPSITRPPKYLEYHNPLVIFTL